MQSLKIRLRVTEIIYILFSMMAMVLCIIGPFQSYKAYSVIAILLFIYLFVLTLHYNSFSLYQIFLITYFVFLLARPFLDLMGAYDFRQMDYFRYETMPDYVAVETIKVLVCFLCGTSYAWLLIDKSPLNTAEAKLETSNITKQKLNQFLKVMFYIYALIFFLKLVYTIINLRSLGYAALFNGGIDSIHYPMIFTGAGTIVELLYILIIYYNRDKKTFVRFTFLYIAIGIVKAFTGQRTTAFLVILFSIYIYSTFYSEIKIYNKKIVVIALLAPFAIEAFAQIRNSMFSFENLLANNILILMLKNMGISVNVVAYYVMYKGSFTNKVPFFLGYIIDAFQKEPAGQTLDDITYGNYLGDHLTYKISDQAFFSGRGTGTSIVAEGYDLVNGNILLVVLFGFIITLVILKLCKGSYSSIYKFVVAYFAAMDFIYSPRWSVLKSIQTCLIGLVVCFIINRFSYKMSSSQNELQLINRTIDSTNSQ